MIINKSFKFKTMVSVESYRSKEESTAAISTKDARKKVGLKRKMAFKHTEFSIDELINSVVSGHSYCGVFNCKEGVLHRTDKKLKYGGWIYTDYLYKKDIYKGAMKITGKRNELFQGTHIITIDIDETKYKSGEEFCNHLTYPPTFLYSSYSDGKEKEVFGKLSKSRRFHLVYIFEDFLKPGIFEQVAQAMANVIEYDTQEQILDTNYKRKAQYFNGNANPKEVFVTYNVYNIVDLKTETVLEVMDKKAEEIVKKEKEEKERADKIQFNEELINDMSTMLGKDVINKWKNKFKIKYRSDVDDSKWIDDEYMLQKDLPDDFMQMTKGLPKKVDSSRKSLLMERAYMYRLVNPEITADALLFGVYCDKIKFFKNDDNKLSTMWLAQAIRYVFSKDYKDISMNTSWYFKRKEKTKIIFKDSISTERKKEIIHEVFNPKKYLISVNPELSRKENISRMKAMGMSDVLIYKKLIAKGITKKKEREEEKEYILSIYDENISIRKNIEKFKTLGISIGKNKLWKFIKEKDTCNNSKE